MLISNCCNKSVRVSDNDGATNWYVCTYCNFPCDVHDSENPKEPERSCKNCANLDCKVFYLTTKDECLDNNFCNWKLKEPEIWVRELREIYGNEDYTIEDLTAFVRSLISWKNKIENCCKECMDCIIWIGKGGKNQCPGGREICDYWLPKLPTAASKGYEEKKG